MDGRAADDDADGEDRCWSVFGVYQFPVMRIPKSGRGLSAPTNIAAIKCTLIHCPSNAVLRAADGNADGNADDNADGVRRR